MCDSYVGLMFDSLPKPNHSKCFLCRMFHTNYQPTLEHTADGGSRSQAGAYQIDI